MPVHISLDRFFPRAADYRGARGQVREEDAGPADAGLPAERLLQCVWYDDALRPSDLRTADGESVTIENPGVWNLEAGPDFLGALLRLGPEQRRLAGDVEIHVRPADWTHHRHRDDPRYARVRVHVTFLPGRIGADALPPGTVQLALRDALAAKAGFSFEDIDSTAYPFALRAPGRTPCAEELRAWTPDDKERLLDAAGEERLRRKAERLEKAVAERGAEQVFYEECGCALGYQHNKIPFRRLAERVPLDVLRGETGGDATRAAALLLGVSGLLAETPPAGADEAVRRGVRRLWDEWWKVRNRWEARRLDRREWRLAGVRPANRPERRILAAAWFFTRPGAPFATLAAGARRNPESFAEGVLRLLDIRPPAAWTRALIRPDGPEALVGEARARAVLINVVVPLLAALRQGAPFDAGLLGALPREELSGLVRGTAHTLFGPDHPPSLYKTGLRRQGLLQIFHDFCLNDRSRCAACALPALLRRQRGE